MSDLVNFLRARLDDDADRAESRLHSGLSVDRASGSPFSPERVLAEVAAKLAIIDLHPNVNDGDCGTCVVGEWGYPTKGGSLPEAWPCPTLRALAQPYAEHPDFDPAWRLP